MLRSAVERQFMIVGEALKQALRLDPTLAESIADSRRIVNFRHVIVHGYSQLEHATIWGIVDDELPKLRTQIEAILKRGQ